MSLQGPLCYAIFFRSASKFFGTRFTRADGTQEIVAVDSRGMPIVEAELDGVVAHLGGRLRPGAGLVHWQNGRAGSVAKGDRDFFLAALVIAGRTGTVIAEQRKFEVALVTISPGDVHTRTSPHVDIHCGWLSSLVNRKGHGICK